MSHGASVAATSKLPPAWRCTSCNITVNLGDELHLGARLSVAWPRLRVDLTAWCPTCRSMMGLNPAFVEEVAVLPGQTLEDETITLVLAHCRAARSAS